MTSGSPRPGYAVLVAAGFLASLAGAQRAQAADLDRVALVWTAPADCPSADTVHHQVEEIVGDTATDLAPVAAVVTVARGIGTWQASLVLQAHGQRSERQYDAESCGALGAAMALIVALAAEGMEPPPPSTTGEAAVQRGSREQPRAPGAPPFWVASSVLVHLGATFDDGTMPYSFAPGIEVTAGRMLEASFWRLRFLGGGSYYFTQTGGGGPSDWYLGTYWLLSFAARACATATMGRFELGPCLGAEFVFMHGDNVGGSQVGDSQYWLSPLVGLLASFTVTSRLGFFGRADVAFPTTMRTFMGRPAFPGGNNPIYDVPPNATRVVAGVELRFF